MFVKDCILIEPYTCREDETVFDIAKKLRTTTLRHIFVVNANMAPTGIISILDINNRVVAEGKDAKTLQAKDIMTKPVDVVTIVDDVESTTRKMIENKRSMNPVVKEGKMVGIITLHQLLKHAKLPGEQK